MNLFDKAVEAVAPLHAMKRQAARMALGQIKRVANTGYSEGGASYVKKSLKGMTGVSASPQLDIDANLWTLRNRSRELYMTSPIAASAIKTSRTNVVGAGLHLKARIDAEYLGLSEEEADAWEAKAEREFEFRAETRKCDALKLNNFYEMQALIFTGWLMNGDGFCLLKYSKPSQFMPYGLRLQLLESDRVCTPYAMGLPLGAGIPFWGQNPQNGNEIYSGVEIDKQGATAAYWICNQYPYAMTGYQFTSPDPGARLGGHHRPA